MKRAHVLLALLAALALTAAASLGSLHAVAQECGAPLGEAEKLAAVLLDACDRVARAQALLRHILKHGWGGRLDTLEAHWLKRPMRFLGYMPIYDWQAVDAILEVSDDSGVDPTFLTVVLYQEGLDVGLKRRRLEGLAFEEVWLDAYHEVGAESVATMQDRLKRLGYLRSDYDGVVLTGDSKPNELHQKRALSKFKSMPDAAEGVAAYLRYCEDHFVAHAKELGIDVSQMSDEEYKAWVYIYYNAGPEKTTKQPSGYRRLVRHRGVLPTQFWHDPRDTVNNARRVAASYQLYKDVGLYDCEKELEP